MIYITFFVAYFEKPKIKTSETTKVNICCWFPTNWQSQEKVQNELDFLKRNSRIENPFWYYISRRVRSLGRVL